MMKRIYFMLLLLAQNIVYNVPPCCITSSHQERYLWYSYFHNRVIVNNTARTLFLMFVQRCRLFIVTCTSYMFASFLFKH